MGAINYKTSNYITIGYDLSDNDYEDEFYNDYIIDEYDNVKYLLNNYDFYYFNIEIEPGYYEGFSINIKYDYYTCFDSYIDKKEALKEITKIKRFLLYCINDYNCCAVAPGWCTTYYSYKDTLKKLNAAIKEMRDKIKNTPTYYTLQLAKQI